MVELGPDVNVTIKYARPTMNSIIDHISNGTVTGKLVLTVALIAAATVIGTVTGGVWARRTGDIYRRFYIRKGVHYLFAIVAAIGVGIIWRPFAGQLGLVIGLISAGLALALQGPIGSVAGGINIMSGSIFRVGDRINLGGVSGDVIDITPTRTTIMEIGSSQDTTAWIHGRQYTGRIVSIANGAAFNEPIYNYSGNFDFVWEEITFTIPYWDNWRQADTIMTEEAIAIDSSEQAQRALEEMEARYPIARADVTPQVFMKATDNYLELAARFVVPVREARHYSNRYTRNVLNRFEQAGISVASTTSDVTVLYRPTTTP